MNSNDEITAQNAYDKMAEEYAERVDEEAYNADLDFPAVTAIMPSVGGKRVLDAGCGSGRYSEWLLEQGAEVVAIDVSAEMVKQAEERVGDRAIVRQADLGESLTFAEDNEFDVIVSTLALHYVRDWRQMFTEFNRILDIGGTFVCSIQHPIDDYLRLEIENYFEIEQVVDTWSSLETPVEVPFYWRPLSKVINPILEAGFRLEMIFEPQPTTEFKKKRPDRYEKLMRRPTFLCIKASC